jgi:hypothetical protein
MPEAANKFSRRSNENLLQLWRGRDALYDEEIDPLRDEIDKRGLSKQAEEIVDQFIRGSIYGDLPPGPQTYGNLSIAYWWLRELRLRRKTRGGIATQATIDSAQRTGNRSRGAARAELLYSYEFQGVRYDGRIVRDFMGNSAQADSLAYDNHPGDKLPILICPEDPAISYSPSQMGSIEPITTGILYLLAYCVLIAGAILFLWNSAHKS